MTVVRSPAGSSLLDVLDRVLDKGIVIDAWVRLSLVGIDLITLEARVVVASIATHLKYGDVIGLPAEVKPALEVRRRGVDGRSRLIGRQLPVAPRPNSASGFLPNH